MVDCCVTRESCRELAFSRSNYDWGFRCVMANLHGASESYEFLKLSTGSKFFTRKTMASTQHSKMWFQ